MDRASGVQRNSLLKRNPLRKGERKEMEEYGIWPGLWEGNCQFWIPPHIPPRPAKALGVVGNCRLAMGQDLLHAAQGHVNLAALPKCEKASQSWWEWN